jgi:hypothetical protein
MNVKDVVKKQKSDARRERAEAHRKLKIEGTVHGTRRSVRPLPGEDKVKRYILTSAQNNTHLHESVWESLTALAKHYKAEIIVGTFSYDQNKFRAMSVKRGKEKAIETTLWYDPRIEPFIKDERIELGKGLVWCGEMNILPTMVSPLAGLETYSARKSAIFPHAKVAMRSIPTMQGEGTKLNFTTGAVTKRNYVQKRVGLIAEHHHVYGGLLVEVNDAGNWWVRQLNADREYKIQDLDVIADGSKVTRDNRVEAITWGDLHATCAEPAVVDASLEMLDELRPEYQFLHDLLEGQGITKYNENNPHVKFHTWLLGLHKLQAELEQTAQLIDRYDRPWVTTVAVDSNHDDPWIQRWLREHDYRKDPPNSELFLKAQTHMYEQIRQGKLPRDINMLGWCLREHGLTANVKFLVADESYLICGKKIECGMHGHLGPNGRRGTPENLAKMGRKANTAHTHSAGIYDGLYVAGTSSRLRWDYNRGPSGWTHSHIVTYPNGKRCVVTIYDGQWRA